MKTCSTNPLLVSVVVAGLELVLTGQLAAQTFTTLYNFKPPSYVGLLNLGYYTNDGGAEPLAALILSSNTLFGTADFGGRLGGGTVFAVKIDGTSFTTLHEFNSSDVRGSGGSPQSALTLSNDTLYGTGEFGFVFAINSDGTGFTTLHTFSDGSHPFVGLILSGNTLYGTAVDGGNSHNGTIFAVNTDGTGFTTLHDFTALTAYYTNTFGDVVRTNRDGANPWAGLVLSGNTLYGTANEGGRWGAGTAFAVNTDGTGFTILHSFSLSSTDSSGVYTNGDGIGPIGSLILSGKTLYGMAAGGGNSHNGTIFAVNTDGTGFTTLHDFTGTSGAASTNRDGVEPTTGLVLSGNTLYGTAYGGGDFGNGTVFAVKTDGTGFTTLHSFTASYTNSDGTYTNSDGADPVGGLLLSGYTLYGTTVYGGISGEGTIFSISFQPQLTINAPGTDVVVTWPTNYAGFDYSGFTLQSTTNLESPVWTTNFPAPFVVNGQNTVTNPIFGTQQFFRLSQ